MICIFWSFLYLQLLASGPGPGRLEGGRVSIEKDQYFKITINRLFHEVWISQSMDRIYGEQKHDHILRTCEVFLKDLLDLLNEVEYFKIDTDKWAFKNRVQSKYVTYCRGIRDLPDPSGYKKVRSILNKNPPYSELSAIKSQFGEICAYCMIKAIECTNDLVMNSDDFEFLGGQIDQIQAYSNVVEVLYNESYGDRLQKMERRLGKSINPLMFKFL